MRALYIDAPDGVSGDMLLGALVDVAGSGRWLEELPERLGLPRVRVICRRARGGRCRGIGVEVRGGRGGVRGHGRPVAEIMRQIGDATLTPSVKSKARQVYRRIAEVEARCHEVPLARVRLHELGDADALIAIVGTVVVIEALGIGRVAGSPLVVEEGRIRSRHGLLPLPSPATVALLRGWPLRIVPGGRERVTPTAAALLSVLAEPVDEAPSMRAPVVGYGIGTRLFDGARGVVRVVVGEEPA